MPLQYIRRPNDFPAYLEAHQLAFQWAEKALVLRSAAKIEEAKAAANHARHWLRIIRALERQDTRSVFQ
jgi:hypothetical protein